MSMSRLSVAALAMAMLGWLDPARAQTATAPQGPSLLPMALALLIVLALIPLALWLLKRFGPAQGAQAGGLRVVAQLPLGTRERIVVVEAGERWLLLGVTGASINRVGSLPKGDLPPAAMGGTSFAALLARAANPKK